LNNRPSSNTHIQDLLSNPEEFNERGGAYVLLQDYFSGLTLSSLKELICNENSDVRKAAIWIASELGEKSREILEEIVSKIDVGDRYFRYHALEVVLVCAQGPKIHHFIEITLALSWSDEVLRRLALRLMVRADMTQIVAAAAQVANDSRINDAHLDGLRLLTEHEKLSLTEFKKYLDASDKTTRLYASVKFVRDNLSSPANPLSLPKADDPEILSLVAEFFDGT
jgi:hypothetical protein